VEPRNQLNWRSRTHEPVRERQGRRRFARAFEQKDIYLMCDHSLDSLDKSATEAFNRFKQEYDDESLKKAIEIMEKIIQLCHSRISRWICENETAPPYCYFDLAHCQRRLAYFLIHDKGNSISYLKARNLLLSALKYYQLHTSTNQAIKSEYMRTLHQLRKIMYELSDGNLLNVLISEYGKLCQEGPSSCHLNEFFELQFHKYFSFGNFSLAESYTIRNIELLNNKISDLELKYELHQDITGEKSTLDELKSSLDTQYLHLIKINIARIANSNLSPNDAAIKFEKTVMKPFWEVYDRRKQFSKSNPKDRSAHELMVKTLIHLFHIRCLQSLLGLDQGKTPEQYVETQAKQIFNLYQNRFYVDKTMRIVQNKIQDIRKQKYLLLDRQFYEDNSPPAINFSLKKINKIFPLGAVSERMSERPSPLFSQGNVEETTLRNPPQPNPENRSKRWR